jgi:hypothetical protein
MAFATILGFEARLESVQATIDAINAELRLLPNLEEVMHGTGVMRPSATRLEKKGAASSSFYGGPGRGRTDDLFHAIFHLGLERSDTGKPRVILRGSAHAVLVAVPCPARVPERH